MNGPPPLNRRDFLGGSAHGFSAMALHGLLQSEGLAAQPDAVRHSPRAKNVIFLFMDGGGRGAEGAGVGRV